LLGCCGDAGEYLTLPYSHGSRLQLSGPSSSTLPCRLSRRYAAFLTIDFLRADFLAFIGCGLPAEARLTAHRFFNAATIAALPAALSLRLRLATAGLGGWANFLVAAHLFCCAAAIRFRAATLILRCVAFCDEGSELDRAPSSIERSSLICESNRRF
jgi:hypothetical protein